MRQTSRPGSASLIGAGVLALAATMTYGVATWVGPADLRASRVAGTGGPVPGAAPASPALDYDCARVAVSSDGNFHDEDDIGASAMTVALLAEKRQQSRLVHWDYSSHLGSSDADREKKMTAATVGTGKKFGYAKGVFHDSQRDLDAAVASLRAAIDKSTDENRLCVLAGGPMGVIYRALDGSDAGARGDVTLISHSGWNEEHDDDENRWNLADIRRDFPDVGYEKIVDQNTGLGTGGGEQRWAWMASSGDAGLAYVHNVIDVLEDKEGDVSDAGMMYYVITGDQYADAGDLTAFLGG
jgi:hypothetical protein